MSATDVEETAGEVELTDGEDTVAGETATTETEAPVLSDAVLARAKEYNLSPDDLQGFDDKKLERLFAAVDRRAMAPQPGPPMQPNIPSPAPGTTPAPVTGGAPQYAPLKLEGLDDLDDSVVKTFQTVTDHVNAQMQELHGFREAARREIGALNLVRELSSFDAFISGLGDDWAKEYGTGPTMELDPRSEAFKTRMEVFMGANSLRTDAARRRQLLGAADARLRSHRAKFWDRVADQEQAKLEAKAERTRRAAGERPTKGQAPADPTGREGAIAAWQK